MSGASRIDSITAKIERAEEHIRDFERERGSFFASEPYSVIRECDEDAVKWIAKIHREIPFRFSLLIGDAIHTLRTSLDHLAWQLVLAGGGTPNENTAFPIFGGKKRFETHGAGKVKGAAKHVIDLIPGFKPYRGGNDELWGLHRLDIEDK